MMTLSLSVDTIIEKAGNIAFAKVYDELFMIAVALGAILLAISVLRIANEYVNAENSGLFSLIKPVLIFLCLCAYPAVSNVIVNITNVFTRELVERVDIDVSDVFKNINENLGKSGDLQWNKVISTYEEGRDKVKQDTGVLDGLMTRMDRLDAVVGEFFSFLGARAGAGLSGLVGMLLSIIIKALTLVLMLLSGVYLLILRVFGSFMFAIAVLPDYSSGIQNWISRYVQLSLWTPLCYSVLSLANGLFASMGDLSLGADYSIGWIVTCFELVLLFALLNIPNLAAWFIESSGANRVHSDMGSGAKSTLKKMITKGK